MGDDSFGTRLLEHFAVGTPAQRAGDAIRRYFSEGYTGSKFEQLADPDPYSITERDFTAVSMLGVEIPAPVKVWLLEPAGRAAVSALLRRIPVDLDLWDAEAITTPGQPLWQLWDLLESACWPTPHAGNGMGMTKTSKLLAAKRPRLVPIVDSVVQRVLPSSNYWRDFAAALRPSAARDRVLDSTPTAPPELSLLRRIDIVVWMLHH